MSWEITVGIIALFSFMLSVMTPLLKLNAQITKLTCAIDELRTSIARSDDRITKHGIELDRHEKRISHLEETVKIQSHVSEVSHFTDAIS